MTRIEKRLLQDKSISYGFPALSDKELQHIIGYKGEDFYNSYEFKAMKEAVRRFEIKDLKKITSSKDCYEYASFLETIEHEEFWVMYLNRANFIQKFEFISKGNTTGTVVGTKEVLKQAIMLKSSAIILMHNHPSGAIKPSSQDESLTKQIKEAAKLIDVSLIDHVIVGKNNYFSFADEGIL